MQANKNSRTKNSVFNLISGFAGKGIDIVLRFVTRTVFIYVLGKSYLGINGLFSDILSMLSLTELGFGMAIGYRLYRPVAKREAKQVRVLMKFYKQAYRCVGAAIAVIGIMMIPMLPILIKDYDRLNVLGINAILIFGMYLFQSISSYLFFAYRTSVIDADQKGYITNTTEIGANVLVNILQIAILLLTGNFILYTAVVIVVNIAKNIFNAVIAKKMYPDFFLPEKDKLSREEITLLFKDCGAAFIYRINDIVLKATDNIVLSSFIGLAMVGMYSNYLMLYTTSKNLLEKFFQACRASLGNIFAIDAVEKKYFMFEVMNFITMVLYGTVCVGIAVVANELINIWIGTDYIIKQPFPLLIAIEVLFSGLKYNLGQIRNVSGVFRQLWYRPIISVLINIIVSVATVRQMGIYGVIIGTLSADLFSNFLLEPVALHKHSFNKYKSAAVYYRKNIGYAALLAIVGCVDYWLCSHISVNIAVLSLIIHILICAVSVPAAFYAAYRRTQVCIYLTDKIKRLVSKKKL